VRWLDVATPTMRRGWPRSSAGLAGWCSTGLCGRSTGACCSEDNLKELRRVGSLRGGERMRRQAVVEEALAHAGRFRQVRDNLEVKEVVVGGLLSHALVAGAQPGAGW